MIENIRKHSKIIIGIFVFVSLAFIAEEGIVYFLRYKEKNKESLDGDILVIGGERVKYSEFRRRLDEKMSYWGRRFGITKNDSFWTKYLKNNLVTEFINNISYKKMAQNIGLKVGKEEIIDLVQGDHINEEIKQNFTDKDGVFKKEELLAFLKKMSKTKEMRKAWEESEQQLKNERNKEKLTKILKNMTVYNDIICEQEWKKEKDKVDIEYLYVPYSIIKDEECVVDEKIEKEYLRDHQAEFQQEENYRIKYFVLNYKLSEDDIKNNLNSLSTLKNKFSICENGVEFAKIKSDKDVKKKHSEEHLLKCSHEDLPKVIKNANVINEGDIFVEIAESLEKPNKIYKIIKNTDQQYEIAVIFKKSFVSEITKNELLLKITKSLKSVNKKEDFEEFAKENNAKIKNKKAKLEESDFEGVDDARELMHNIIKNYKKPQNNFIFKIDPFETSSGVFCGIVEKHEKKGTRDFEDIKEDLRLKCIQKIKFNKIVEKIKNVNAWNLTFDEIKNKNIEFIKFGEDKNLDFTSKRIKEYGRTKFGLNNILLLNEGENTNFFEDDNGALMIKVVKIKKNEDTNSVNENYKKFYDEKFKNKNSLENIEKLFEQRFAVENYKDIWM